MIILLMAILACVMVLGILLQYLKYFRRNDMESVGLYLIAISVVIWVILGALAIVMAINLTYVNTIDAKIDMYTSENKAIESQVDELVKNYMKYETGTLKEFKSTDSITLVSLYPELKSDNLVRSQIDSYVSNNEVIKKLKEQKINGSIYRWWLYFGK